MFEKSGNKKLVLNRETIRGLAGKDMQAVVGGFAALGGLKLDQIACTTGYCSCSCKCGPDLAYQQVILPGVR